MSLSQYFFDPQKRLTGLDLTGLRPLLIRGRGQAGKGSVVSFARGEALEESISDGLVVNKKKLVDVLTKAAASVRATSLSMVIPERHVFVKNIETPGNTQGDMSEAVRWEASQHIPLEPAEMYLDWDSVPYMNEQRTIIVAAASSVIDRYTEAAEESGPMVVSLEPVSTALYRLISLYQPATAETQLYVWLGEVESTAIVLEQGHIALTASVPFSSSVIEQELMDRYRLSIEEAHEARVLIGLSDDRAEGAVHKYLKQEELKLANRLIEVVKYYREHVQNGASLASITLAGPGALTRGIAKVISDDTKISTQVLKALPGMRLPKKNSDQHEFFHTYALAISAAFRKNI